MSNKKSLEKSDSKEGTGGELDPSLTLRAPSALDEVQVQARILGLHAAERAYDVDDQSSPNTISSR